MNKKLGAILLTILLLQSINAIGLANANPMGTPSHFKDFFVDVKYVGMFSSNGTYYVNSTATVNMLVYRYENSPEIKSAYYTVDDKPPVYLAVSKGNYSADPYEHKWYGYYSHYRVVLEHLSEGNHTVKIWAINANDSVKSSVTKFTVNNHYQITVLKVLSPTNGAIYNGTVPLNITVNGKVDRIGISWVKPFGFGVTHGPLEATSNITMELPSGAYEISLHVSAEKGPARASVNFTVDNGASQNITPSPTNTGFMAPTLANTAFLFIIALFSAAIISGAYYTIRKRKQRPL